MEKYLQKIDDSFTDLGTWLSQLIISVVALLLMIIPGFMIMIFLLSPMITDNPLPSFMNLIGLTILGIISWYTGLGFHEITNQISQNENF